MACWDMRFQLPISSHCHPSRARIRRLSMHPLYQSWVIAGKMEGWLSCVGRFSWKVHNNLLPKLTFLVSFYIWTECLILFWLWRLPLLIPHCHLIFIMFKNDLISHHHYSPFLTVHHHLLSFFLPPVSPSFVTAATIFLESLETLTRPSLLQFLVALLPLCCLKASLPFPH